MYRLVSLKQYHAAALVSCCEVIARLVELNGGDDISYGCCQNGVLMAKLPKWAVVVYVPSVMSSTSPLSPKHLAESVLPTRRTRAWCSCAKQHHKATAGLLLQGEVLGWTYCVNFHVVGLPSASTMIGPGLGGQAGTEDTQLGPSKLPPRGCYCGGGWDGAADVEGGGRQGRAVMM